MSVALSLAYLRLYFPYLEIVETSSSKEVHLVNLMKLMLRLTDFAVCQLHYVEVLLVEPFVDFAVADGVLQQDSALEFP